MARVYVGTYRKYNAGNLEGAWLDLSDFETYADFLAACAKVHENEPDPEFMIQDSEGFPDGLNCMEWLSEADFLDVKDAMKEEAGEDAASRFTVIDYSEKAVAVTGDTRGIAGELKALGGRFNPRLSCGPGWIFSKRKESELRSLLSGAKVQDGPAPERKKGEGDAYAAVIDEWVSTLKAGDRDYYRKGSAAAVRFPEGYLVIEKPRIENKFCFHDEGPQYEMYCDLMKDEGRLRRYFLRENLSDLDERIALMENRDEALFLVRECWGGTVRAFNHHGLSYCYKEQQETARVMTDGERKAVAAALRFVRDSFEKRLQAYLKRYGVSKLHTWTYWADA